MKINADGIGIICKFEEYNQISATEAEKIVNRLVKIELNNDQFSALVSLVTSIDLRQFKKSSMLRLINTGQILMVSEHFGEWVTIHNKKDKRLARRRRIERELFFKPQIVGGKDARCPKA